MVICGPCYCHPNGIEEPPTDPYWASLVPCPILFRDTPFQTLSIRFPPLPVDLIYFLISFVLLHHHIQVIFLIGLNPIACICNVIRWTTRYRRCGPNSHYRTNLCLPDRIFSPNTLHVSFMLVWAFMFSTWLYHHEIWANSNKNVIKQIKCKETKNCHSFWYI